ncbi:hypothetical protein D1AOALGA4SA_1473 [Olavius algarvensis Delta 1 endosymbiont]|nr:hypothetical protein D1AOALGA4SA_1473 [Olavius algarvensis Delta 1 endosymbiont]
MSGVSRAAVQTNGRSNRKRNFVKSAKYHISASDVSYSSSCSCSSSRLLSRFQYRGRARFRYLVMGLTSIKFHKSTASGQKNGQSDQRKETDER